MVCDWKGKNNWLFGKRIIAGNKQVVEFLKKKYLTHLGKKTFNYEGKKKCKYCIDPNVLLFKSEENISKVLLEIEKAVNEGAQIICLQELFRSLYFCDVEEYDNFDLAESIPGPTTHLLAIKAKEYESIVIIASLFEKRSSGIYHNTVAVIDADGTYLGKYEKCTYLTIPAILRNFISLLEI